LHIRVRSDADVSPILEFSSRALSKYVQHLTIQIEKDNWILAGLTVDQHHQQQQHQQHSSVGSVAGAGSGTGSHHDHDHDHDHDHAPGEACDHPHHHHHDDDVKSFVFRSERAFNPAKLEDFLGAIVQVYGPKMLRYKGVLYMKGSDRTVVFQGVHQMMGSDLGPKWAPAEKKNSKMVFIGIDLPKEILLQGLESCLV